jgi:hypothetical protein
MASSMVFTSCQTGYQNENGQWAWVSYDEYQGKRLSFLDSVDAESFSVMSNNQYGLDKYHVYFKGQIVYPADPKTFQLIDDKGYSADAQHVFLDAAMIALAHPLSFKVLQFPYSKDDQNIFCGTIPMRLSKEEQRSFKVVEGEKNMVNTRTITDLKYFIEFNPDYQWLDTLPIKKVITGEWGMAEVNGKRIHGFKIQGQLQQP